MDVAVTNEQGNVYVYKNGAGSGALTLTDSITLDSEASGIVAADVNHDGHIDLVYDVGNANTGGGGTLHVLLGNGDGTFTVGPTITFIMNNQPAGSLAVGDFDGDGIGDIMVIGGALADTEVLYGDNAGNFTPGPVLGGLDSGGQ